MGSLKKDLLGWKIWDVCVLHHSCSDPHLVCVSTFKGNSDTPLFPTPVNSIKVKVGENDIIEIVYKDVQNVS